MHYRLSQWRESSTIPHLPNPHHRLLRSVLQQVKTWSPYVDSSPCSSTYPFPSMLLHDLPPVWTALKPKVSRTALKCAPPPLHQVSLPLDPACQRVMKSTAALLKKGTLETIRTHHTPNTLYNSGDTSHLVLPQLLRSTPIFLFPLYSHLHASSTSTCTIGSTSTSTIGSTNTSTPSACLSSSNTSSQLPHHHSLQTSFTTTHGGSTSRAAARRDGTRP